MLQRLPWAVLAGAAALLSLSPLRAEPAKKAAPAPDGWKTLFDGKSLAGWKEADFYKPGKVTVKDGAIIMAKGNMMTGVTYARADFPKMDYEVTLEGRRVEGRDFFCTTTFPVGKSFCSLVVGGWGGQIVGLSSINGADASENESSSNKEFRTGQWYRVRVRVTPKRIQAWIDAARVVDIDTEDREISIRIECEECKPFGVCTWDTVGAVRDIRVRRLTEAEKKATAQGK
jgi:hypothetical protein